MILCKEKDCTGCGLCKEICKQHAISMVTDNLGFLHPVIDEDICIDCGLCRLKCPELNPVKREPQNTCYLAWANNDEIHYNSASGGISYLLAHNIVSKGGFAVGCVWDKDFNAVLKVIDNIGELHKTMGSKYVQSYIACDTWNDIRQRLRRGERGIFFGLPCQVAAIKTYTNNHNNLFFCDLLCHGGCSPFYHHEHLEYIKNNKSISSITDVKYRGGNCNFRYTLWSNKELKYNKSLNEDTYYHSFVKHYFFHDTCYKCQYANASRVSDITIGDFWGIDPTFLSGKNKMNGTNLILIHTEKGNMLWADIQEGVEAYQRDFDEAVRGNDTLKEPTKIPLEREELLNRIREKGFEKAIKTSEGYIQKRNELRRNCFKNRVGKLVPQFAKTVVKTIINK